MTDPTNHTEASADHKLDSWKRIAAYLGKTVRTVQRWEREEGLPVLRHHHQKRGTVYALTQEIDAWLATRSATNNRHATTRRPVLIAIGSAIAIAGILVGSWLIFNNNTQAPVEEALTFEERPWVLMVPLENLTGDPRLTDALDYSVYQGLVATHKVSIASPERVQDTLQLMRAGLDRKLDLKLALEISNRDTQITTIVAGRVQRVGSAYTLGLETIDAGTGQATEVVSGEVDQIEDLLRLSRNLASRLVDSVDGKAKPEQELETVTTNSLRAAQLYSLANKMLVRENLGGRNMNAAAEELLREAVTADPDFASAHLLLGWSIARQGKPQSEVLPHADRAFELIQSASEVERFFIRGSHLSLSREFEASIPIYQALIDRYPDHFWGTSNLAYALNQANRLAEAADVWARLADLRPTSRRLNHRVAYFLAALGDSRAESIITRVQKLTTPGDWEGNRGYSVFWIEALAARQAWLEGDLQEFVSELGRLDSIKDQILDTQERQKAEADLAIMEITLGRSEAGLSQLAALRNDFDFRDELLVRAAYSVGDNDAMGNYLDDAILTVEAHRYPYTIIPHLLARAGRVSEAKELFGQLQLAPETEVALRGALALAQNNHVEAVDILTNTHDKTMIADEGYYLSGEVLTEAFLKMELPQRAKGILEKSSKQRARSTAVGSMPAWIRNQQLLAILLRDMGEKTQATEIEAELSRLLALGDEDHPIRIWLTELR